MKLFHKNKKTFFILLIFISFTVLILHFLLNSNFILWGNDLMSNTSYFIYIKNSLLNQHIFPQWNYYYKLGAPIVGDPLNSIYNPFVFIIFILFPYALSIQLVYFLCFFFSCASMYLLSKYFNLQKTISIIIALTYASSGYLVARIIAGHWEKIIAYAFIPIFYLFLIKLYKKPNLLFSGIIALIISLFIFSASIYEAFYSVIILILMIIFTFIEIIFRRDIKKNLEKIFYALIALFLIPLFSAIKLLPMLQINQMISRNYNPFLGSQNILTIIYNFFIPSQSIIKLLGLDKYFASPYFWWESFAFVGPIFALGLILCFYFRKKIIKNPIPLLLFILVSLFAFSMLANKFNPFYWLFQFIPPIREFRIPSRVFIYMVPLVILIGSMGINYLYIKTKYQLIKVILVIALITNLLITVTVFRNYAYTKPLPSINPSSSSLLTFLKQKDNTKFFIAQNVLFQNQILLYQAIENEQMILNAMYGWKIFNNFTGNYVEIDFTGVGKYLGIYPKYFIYPKDKLPPKDFKIILLKEDNGMSLYKNSLYTPYAYTTNDFNKINISTREDPNIKSIKIEPNKIEILAFSSLDSQKLVVIENYFPGWKLSIDNKDQPITKNSVLTANMKVGVHKYTFKFFSDYSVLGFFVTIVSLLSWSFIVKIRLFKK